MRSQGSSKPVMFTFLPLAILGAGDPGLLGTGAFLVTGSLESLLLIKSLSPSTLPRLIAPIAPSLTLSPD